MKPTITVAVGGHAGHGKSTLVKMLTGAATSRAQLANARDTVVETDVAFVLLADAPAASWASLDATGRADVLLVVVDAARGPQAFTRDVVETARALGVPRVIAFVHDRDNPVDHELFDAAELLLREIVDAAGYDANDVPVVRGPIADGGALLLRALAETSVRVVDRDAELAMPASFSFTTRPRAWVCTGRIAAGALHKGDRVHVVGSRHELRVDDV
ncbi:MAG TPA: GTP-binding protein, partial [Myxococcota bacterium]